MIVARPATLRGRPLFGSWQADGPWEQAEYVGLAARLGISAVGILAAWIGCSKTVVWTSQQAWTAGGIAALVFGLSSIAVWIQNGLRAVRGQQRELLAEAQERFLAVAADAPAAVVATTAPRKASTGSPVTGPGMTLYHRPDCLLVRRKDTHPVTRSESRTLEPCQVCSP